MRNARKEAEQSKPPKAFRELFQLIKATLEANLAETDDDEIETNANDADESNED